MINLSAGAAKMSRVEKFDRSTGAGVAEKWVIATSSLVCGLSFVFGFALIAGPLRPYIGLVDRPDLALQFISDNYSLLYVWNAIIYLLFGVALLFLNAALSPSLGKARPVMKMLVLMFGGVWAAHVIASGMLANVSLGRVLAVAEVDTDMAEQLWLVLYTVTQGIGGNNELVGGLWLICLCLAGRGVVFGHYLAVFGVVIGACGCLTLVPSLQYMGAVFGLGLILWFVLLAFSCARRRKTD